MRQILGAVHLLLVIEFNLFRDFVDLALNVVEGPLLRFLHLNHHLLNLLELLEAVGLHFFELLLFGYKHVEPCLVVPKEGMLDDVTFLVGDGHFHG